ncbi:hypothetical protein FACS1894127_7580 [Clostridia bacterium]|nr:hypothetical protein FACS1894127_7580 [Clostridia bacterium]
MPFGGLFHFRKEVALMSEYEILSLMIQLLQITISVLTWLDNSEDE